MSNSSHENASTTDASRKVHELVDPLRDGGVLSDQECDDICADLARLLVIVYGEGRRPDEDYWHRLQAEFEFSQVDPVVMPMNAANLCPEPTTLLNCANTLRRAYNTNVAQQTRMAGGHRVRQLEEARTLLAGGLRLNNSSDLAIVRNASEGNNAISCGYRHWTRTDEREDVVLWSENHPTNLEAWRLRAQWDSAGAPLFDVEEVTFSSASSNREIADAFISKIGNRTRFVSFSATSNSSGFRMPDPVIQDIWNHVQSNRPNCHVHIDGTMEWGARAIDLSNPRCHSFVSSAHKWFLGPKETGILYMSPDKAENFSPSIFAYDYKIEIGPWPNMPKNALRFELLGQRDDVNIITLAWTQMFWDAFAPLNDPYRRVSDLAQHLKDQLLRPQPNPWTLVTPASSDKSLGVVRVLAPQGRREKTLYHWLYDTHRIAGSGDSATFRLCPHIYNTKRDVEDAVAGMNAWRALEP